MKASNALESFMLFFPRMVFNSSSELKVLEWDNNASNFLRKFSVQLFYAQIKY
jgi:hypothetical protein